MIKKALAELGLTDRSDVEILMREGVVGTAGEWGRCAETSGIRDAQDFPSSYLRGALVLYLWNW